ncbi:hypothetical protein RCG23_13615 [Neobacillus sp. PS3-34]|uniref:hypothetical protein n=1 Tax=Neobacillus sp. PS3-34 TaxID=3070678 RepID=UPI0027E1EF8E|nr:hypothetical protein [Neobacillus sp. PS3-34]WML46686.1 hypothetical protein RCG23_13615 [Neobacillus sp. PS3-34]
MNYFILYVTFKNDLTEEMYVKGKSINYILEQIGRYTDGIISTSHTTISTHHAKSIYVRQIDLNHFPHLSKRDFRMINENQSYNYADLN